MTELMTVAVRQALRMLAHQLAERMPEFVGAPLPGTTRDRYPWSPKHVSVWATGELEAAARIWSADHLRGWRVGAANSEPDIRYGYLHVWLEDPAGVRYSLESLASLGDLKQAS